MNLKSDSAQVSRHKNASIGYCRNLYLTFYHKIFCNLLFLIFWTLFYVNGMDFNFYVKVMECDGVS